jgi:nucleoside-diphosphate-sugar epimerase
MTGRALVTGGAGFIGSHLAEALLARGDEVVVVDSLTDYYDPDVKRANLSEMAGTADVREVDLRDADLAPLLEGVDVVYHLAGQPGVRLSWDEGFPAYATHNVLATQRLLEACRRTSIERFVYASSSSVYGDAERYPTDETDLPLPRSPYGVTKLAGEHLCRLYGETHRTPTTSLRYFTVYGPRQRPDMAFHRLCRAALDGSPFPLYGDGSQVRDATYVSDVVAANLAAGAATDLAPGTVVNVSGGSSVSLMEVIRTVEDIAGEPITLDRSPAQAGDVFRTGGATHRARALLGWEPEVDLRAGLEHQLTWHQKPQMA